MRFVTPSQSEHSSRYGRIDEAAFADWFGRHAKA